MARVYAGIVDAWPDGDAPSNADALLRIASRVVDQLLRGVVYDVDAAGLPTDPDVAQALNDATCAIAVEAGAAGVGKDAAGWDSVSIGNVSLSGRRTPDGAVAVGGITVPAWALVSLADVGRLTVVLR